MPEKKEQRQNQNNRQNGKTVADGLFDMLNPNNMLNNAQKVINSAVNVLEEEIAAGILAAKNIERKVFNVDELRSNPENLMNRIRKDTHEALDIFLDAFSSLSKQIGILTDVVAQENIKKTDSSTAPPKSNNHLQILEPDEPAIPGQELSYHFSLNEDSISEPIQLDLQKTEFTGLGQQKISTRYIQVYPTSFLLQPKEEKEITVVVRLPKNCLPGHYNSLFTVAQMPAIKIVLTLEVK